MLRRSFLRGIGVVAGMLVLPWRKKPEPPKPKALTVTIDPSGIGDFTCTIEGKHLGDGAFVLNSVTVTHIDPRG